MPTQDERVEFDQVRENKEKLLRKAFHQSEKGLLPEIRQFLRDERWVSDFALFTAVKQHFGGVMWRQWPDEGIKMRRKESLLQYRMMLDEDVRYHVFCQFIFFRQWKEFKAYCNSKGIGAFRRHADLRCRRQRGHMDAAGSFPTGQEPRAEARRGCAAGLLLR